MLQRMDVRGELEDLGVRCTPIFSGMRLTVRIKDDYMTTGIIEFEEEISGDGRKDVTMMFISPKYYANTLWIGKRMELYEGSKLIGYITVTEILNEILDSEAEKWVLLDGRKIHSKKEFYEQVQEQLTKGIDFQIGRNLNAFNDVLRGGFGFHEYGEVLHIVWIYAEESKQFLGKDYFDTIVDIIEKHEHGNKYLELYKEHVM